MVEIARTPSGAREIRTRRESWWHPHNFGRDAEANLALLRGVLEHYRHLHETAGMLNLTMREVAERAITGGEAGASGTRLTG